MLDVEVKDRKVLQYEVGRIELQLDRKGGKRKKEWRGRQGRGGKTASGYSSRSQLGRFEEDID